MNGPTLGAVSFGCVACAVRTPPLPGSHRIHQTTQANLEQSRAVQPHPFLQAESGKFSKYPEIFPYRILCKILPDPGGG